MTENTVAEPLPQSNETVQFFDVGLPQPYRIEGDAVTQRQRFVAELNKETAKQGSYTAAYQTVVDKVAYTWFNRFMAIRIMQKQGFISPVLAYESEEVRVPVIVSEALSLIHI